MNIETFRDYCLEKKGVTEGLPFGPDDLVLKVMGKMFTIASLDEVPLRVNLKCDPEKAISLREEYPDNIFPGYHMNKKLWNTLILDGRLSNSFIFELIDHSYDLVVLGLTKKLQKELQDL
ncbi:MmcQ/YjbR family DNA-binding protein [Antarcticibacterium arcticum]|uniref:MmcQ/YjbR family DNA-binding protein n=1 Tax=Antarcticibacterium arcticum TaxID=2585771 RepID=A0A5B8YKV1_9FLAO|nr:MmcQ/YjbR family DNA-binding protein [Antarcticibacterium arcticum]QED38241.1 MmcQ/YjbR family DNA-binding protein [Antarcticibacterium arcticum]